MLAMHAVIGCCVRACCVRRRCARDIHIPWPVFTDGLRGVGSVLTGGRFVQRCMSSALEVLRRLHR
jgi:hypothetical protein